MGNYNYNKIREIEFSSTSSGMMMGSAKGVITTVMWQYDGPVILRRIEIDGFIREESTWNLTAEQIEEVRAAAEKIDMASWGELKWEEDPRLFCYDYTREDGGSIILFYIVPAERPFVKMEFDRRAVVAAGKGEDLKMMEDLLKSMENPDTRSSYEKRNTADIYKKTNTADLNMWTCECGAQNTSKFCPNCGRKRP